MIKLQFLPVFVNLWFMNKRIISNFKITKRLFFKKSDIVKWITSSKVTTKEELNQLADGYIFKNPLS